MDLQDVKAAARGRWQEILTNVGGIRDDHLTDREGPCPKCGGNTRFRFTNLQNNGSIFCSHCARGLGDGFDAIGWILGLGPSESIKRVGEYLGLKNGASRIHRSLNTMVGINGSTAADRTAEAAKELERIKSQLTEVPWNEAAVAMWCYRRNSSGLTDPESLKSCGAFCAKYKPGNREYYVLVVPCLDDESVVGFFLFNLRDKFLPGKKLQDGSWEQLKAKAVGQGLGVAG